MDRLTFTMDQDNEGDDGCIGNRRVRGIVLSWLLIAFMAFGLAYFLNGASYWKDLAELPTAESTVERASTAWEMICAGAISSLAGGFGVFLVSMMPNPTAARSCQIFLANFEGLALIVGGILYIVGWIWYTALSSDDLRSSAHWEAYPEDLKRQTEAIWASWIGEALLPAGMAILLGLNTFQQRATGRNGKLTQELFDNEHRDWRLSANIQRQKKGNIEVNQENLRQCPLGGYVPKDHVLRLLHKRTKIGMSRDIMGIPNLWNIMAFRLASNLGLILAVSILCMSCYYSLAEDLYIGSVVAIETNHDGVEAIATGYLFLWITCLIYLVLYICTCCACNVVNSCLMRTVLAGGLIIGGVITSIGYYVFSGGYENASMDTDSGKVVAYYIGYTVLVGGLPVVWALDIALDHVKNSSKERYHD